MPFLSKSGGNAAAGMLTAYMDESFNQRTMCVGGWLCHEQLWRRLENQWSKRVALENRRSARMGLPPISRYHASDLANLQGEYREKNGWTIERQIQFAKKLIDIIGRFKPVAITCGLWFKDLISASPEWDRDHPQDKWEWAAYRLCMMTCLKLVLDTIHRSPQLAGEKVAVVYEHGKFNSAGQSAFDSTKDSPKFPNRDDLLTMAPMDWQNCALLQPADLIAYEGFKLVDRRPESVREFRKSLQRIIGTRLTVRAHLIRREGLVQMMENHIRANAEPSERRQLE